jgi:hypothetical protein
MADPLMVGKSARETLVNMLGFSDDVVARTGQINGPGVAARQRLAETLSGTRPATPMEYLAYLKFVWDRGIGLPTKMRDDAVQKASVLFVSQSGYVPFDARAHPEIDERSRRMNAANDEEIRLRALEKAKPPEVLEAESKAADESETLEVVKPLPPEDPSAYR